MSIMRLRIGYEYRKTVGCPKVTYKFVGRDALSRTGRSYCNLGRNYNSNKGVQSSPPVSYASVLIN